MSQFTKGKWEYAEHIRKGVTINGMNYLIFIGSPNPEDDGEDIAFVHREADARLIAAAPEMYSLLKQVAYGTCDDCMPMLVSARKLLAHIDGKENEMTDSSKFFSNINCEYFPCHTGVDADSFNCMFCYCPLYGMFDCPGSPKFLPNGVKDCSNCTLPHIDINYDAVITKLKEAFQA